jgi:chorismate mutase
MNGAGQAAPERRAGVQEELATLRAEVAALDRELLALLSRRRDLARRILPLKRHAGLPVLDPAVEAAVVRAACDEARRLRLPEEPARAILWHVIALCRAAQEEEA